MQRICIAIVDAARARLYTFDELAGPSGTPTQELREQIDLVDPDRRLRPSELFSDTRPGSDRAPSGRGYGVSDGREAHLEQMDRRFAAEIVARLAELVREHACHRLIVVATPRMLGELRQVGGRLLEGELPVDEVSRDLTRLSSAQIHDHLAARGLLPPRERLAVSPR
jgi:protein required for attachment to host cells